MTASKDLPPLTNFGKIFWQNQFRTKIELPDSSKLPSLKNKTAIVTGANTGLGFEAAKQLLALGLTHLVIAVRSIEKGNAAAESLRKSAGSSTRIDVWTLDMESYDSIQAFVHRCQTDLSRIDYVILNAGLSPVTFHRVKLTGHETTVQVNHISTALLAVLLIPILREKSKADSPARLTVVNSLTAHMCSFTNRDQQPLLPSFDDEKLVAFDHDRYGVSKLLNQLFLVRLADLVDSRNVTINMVDPGLVKGTGLAREATGLMRLIIGALQFIAGRPVDRGAATYVHALLGLGQESHGCFLMSNHIAP